MSSGKPFSSRTTLEYELTIVDYRSFIGYSNVNYALSEVKNPVRTLKIAGPLALGSVSVVYMLVNIAYFAAVPKEDILTSGQTVAALYFRNMFGASAERALDVFVALSALGNVLSVLFSQGRSEFYCS